MSPSCSCFLCWLSIARPCGDAKLIALALARLTSTSRCRSFISRTFPSTIPHIGAADDVQGGGERFLAEIISTVGSSLDLEEVLDAVVRLLSDASAVHACFVYLLDADGDSLDLYAASEPYRDLAGRISLKRGQGLAWWALERRESAFIRDNALDDPRFHHVPELEEERFQSFVSVPLLGRAEKPIGVISLHTEAPREFTEAEAAFLASSAALVAGAIENARLYEQMGERVLELEHLTELGEEVAAAETLDELGPLAVRRALDLLGASAVHLYLAEQEGERLFLRWSAPQGADAPHELGLSELGGELGRRGRSARVSVSLAAGGAVLGDVAVRAERLAVDLDDPHVVLAAVPASDALERALARIAPRSVFDRQDNSSRALLRIPVAGLGSLVEAVRRVHAEF